jgi:membrane associated rhomboid family serine protease
VLAGETDERWTEIRQFRQQSEAEQHALVLIAMSINCLLIRRPWGIGLLVAAPDAERAEYQLQEYTAENRPRPSQTPPFPLARVIDGALIFAAVLVFVQAAADGMLFGLDWFSAGAAQAGLITGGEWWRAVTSLGLHADLGHLLSNLAFGAFFGIFLCQLLGTGLGWLSILAAGSLGNVISAIFQSDAHTAIGASTAVFAALGLLAGLTWLGEAYARSGLRRFAPLAGGVMLLAFLGVGGERTDIGGHVAGFAAGILLAFAIHFFSERIRKDRPAQLRFAAAALTVFAGAWVAALTSAG